MTEIKPKEESGNEVLADVLKSVCDCGNPINSKYDPCCSLKCWSDKFE